MQEVNGNSPHLTQLYYSEVTGVVVYFKKRWNGRYDAHEAASHIRLLEYCNLTWDAIRRVFEPYKKESRMKPVVTHLSENLDRMSDTISTIDNPSDLSLHHRMETFINTTKSNIHPLMRGER